MKFQKLEKNISGNKEPTIKKTFLVTPSLHKDLFMNTVASIHPFKNHRNINDKKEMKNLQDLTLWQPVCGIGWLSLNDFVSLQIIMKSGIVLPKNKIHIRLIQ